MRSNKRLRVTVSLPADLLSTIDRQANQIQTTRSGVMESWLQNGRREAVQRALQTATIDYYRSLNQEDRDENEAISVAASKAARRLDVDGDGEKRKPPRRALRR